MLRVKMPVPRPCDHERCRTRGTYAVKVSCWNCSWDGYLHLTRGHEFDHYREECPACDCRTLARAIKQGGS